jgi:PIN domain nuclease of toxin-antitoxin system
MRLLLDTHVFLWLVSDSRKLKAPARKLIAEAGAAFVSSASIWEIAIKASIGKIEADPAALAQAIEGSGFQELPVSANHAARVARLPKHHGDPFDRLLLAQALSEPLIFVTADADLRAYGEFVELIR